MFSEDDLRKIVDVLDFAEKDIRDWIVFAERQMKELDGWENLPCGPTQFGVAFSNNVREKINKTLLMIRESMDAETLRLADGGGSGA